MTLAELIAAETLRTLGFRDPKNHPKWEIVVDGAQKHIDHHMEMMKRVAAREYIGRQKLAADD